MTITAVVIALAAEDLREIISSQRDFVIGALLVLVGFCVAKTLTVYRQERLRAEQAARVLLLDRSLRAAIAQLTDYSRAQAATISYLHQIEPLRVAMDELDRCRGNLAGLLAERAVPDQLGAEPYELVVAAARSLREAAAHRDQLYDTLPKATPERDALAVLTADLIQAELHLGAALSPNPVAAPLERLHAALACVRAATQRAGEVTITDPPARLEILRADLSTAEKLLDRATRPPG
ncbi:hypothetical protein [Nocardia sp. NPDC051832]|uniref:hypothetical protein n=1 Tax=Nocardia sp. NPDC051832 TaxID=3155673 RepID=UPI00342470B9